MVMEKNIGLRVIGRGMFVCSDWAGVLMDNMDMMDSMDD